MLSKSKFVNGLQCKRKFFLDLFKPYLAAPITDAQQAIFDSGTLLGQLARKHPFWGSSSSTRLISAAYWQHPLSESQTRECLQHDPPHPRITTLFEAGFSALDVNVRVDILTRSQSHLGTLRDDSQHKDDDDTWHLVEVKSGTSPKDEHIYDLAIQALILKESGIKLGSCSLMLVNRDYVYPETLAEELKSLEEGQSNIDPSDFFVFFDRTRDVEILSRDQVLPLLHEMRDLISSVPEAERRRRKNNKIPGSGREISNPASPTTSPVKTKPWASHTVVELKKVLREKGLVLKGNKADLVTRLEYYETKVELEARESRQEQLESVDPLEPKIEPSPHCFVPYDCRFWEHCAAAAKYRSREWIKYLPRVSTPLTRQLMTKLPNQAKSEDSPKEGREGWKHKFNLNGERKMTKFEYLEKNGMQNIKDIPDDFSEILLTPLQQRVRNAILQNKEFIDVEGLQEKLGQLKYPLYYLDFESFMPAVPIYAGTKPYQAIPNQWSCHRESEEGELSHEEFLADWRKTIHFDPRSEFAESLAKMLKRDRGSILIYTSYEIRMIKEVMGLVSPEIQRNLQAVISRCVDLKKIVEDHYYHPNFKGSFSIKQVLPALMEEESTEEQDHVSYKKLAIQDGSMASIKYQEMMSRKTPRVTKEKIERDLKLYCGLDTLAMVKVKRKLMDKVKAAAI